MSTEEFAQLSLDQVVIVVRAPTWQGRSPNWVSARVIDIKNARHPGDPRIDCVIAEDGRIVVRLPREVRHLEDHARITLAQ